MKLFPVHKTLLAACCKETASEITFCRLDLESYLKWLCSLFQGSGDTIYYSQIVALNRKIHAV